MKNLRYLVPLALILALAAAPSFVQAQRGFGGPGHGPGGKGFGDLGMLKHFLKMGELLNLTKAQEGQIQAILDAAQPEIETLTEQMRQGRETWMENHEPTEFNETQARAFVETQTSLQAELMIIGMKTRADVLSVLSPEQLEELKTLRENMRDRRGGRRGGDRP